MKETLSYKDHLNFDAFQNKIIICLHLGQEFLSWFSASYSESISIIDIVSIGN